MRTAIRLALGLLAVVAGGAALVAGVTTALLLLVALALARGLSD